MLKLNEMKNLKLFSNIFCLIAVGVLLSQCAKDENTPYVRPTTNASTHQNDVYITKYMLDPYGTAVRWRWDNRFILPTQSATPIQSDLVIPVTQILEYLWAGVYEAQGQNGQKLIKQLFPPELQYIGSYIYKDDGSQVLGFAEGGARITLLNLNKYDLKNRDWLSSPNDGVLGTAHHEFTHIVHQNYGLPTGFKGITNYNGNGWMNISENDAIKAGAISPYGTNNEFEDFAELVGHYIVMPKADFEKKYILQEDCSQKTKPADIQLCQELNAGKLLIDKKLSIVTKFYKDQFGIDLVALRDTMENRLNIVIENNKIPGK